MCQNVEFVLFTWWDCCDKIYFIFFYTLGLEICLVTCFSTVCDESLHVKSINTLETFYLTILDFAKIWYTVSVCMCTKGKIFRNWLKKGERAFFNRFRSCHIDLEWWENVSFCGILYDDSIGVPHILIKNFFQVTNLYFDLIFSKKFII